MKISVFYSFCMMLTFAIFQFYMSTKNHFSGLHEAKYANKVLQAKLDGALLEKRFAQYELVAFANEVGELAPKLAKQHKSEEEGYPYRSLASVTTKKNDSKLKELIDKGLYKRGVSNFKNRNYTKAVSLLSQFVKSYSYSKDSINAYALQVECYYQLKKLDKALEVVNVMLEQFPEHELTGYSLIRLGNIYQKVDRDVEASQMYTTVLQVFRRNRELRRYAQQMISRL